jgi:membrane protein implicated in regulation of membrane protease activity
MWIVLAVVLVAIELHHLAFFAAFAALGAVAAATVAFAAPGAVAAQVVIAVGVGAVGVVAVRPWMSAAFARRSHGARIAGVHGGLIGMHAISDDAVHSESGGHVVLLGERWLATTLDDAPIAPGTPVIVTSVHRTTLTVRAVEIWEEPT